MKKEQLSSMMNDLFNTISQEDTINGEILSISVETSDDYSDRGIVVHVTTDDRYDSIDADNFSSLNGFEIARYKNYHEITVFTFAFSTDIPTKAEWDSRKLNKK